MFLDAQKNRLNETVLLSAQNIYFGFEIRKVIFDYALFILGFGHVFNFYKKYLLCLIEIDIVRIFIKLSRPYTYMY